MTYWNFLIKFHLSNNTNKKGYILNFNVLSPEGGIVIHREIIDNV